MKKLNQTELKVLANKINKELMLQAEIAQKEYNEVQDKQNLADARLALRQLRKLSETARRVVKGAFSYDESIDTLTEEKILRQMRKKQTSVRCGYLQEEIMSALILGQITCPDMESLCNNVAQQFISKQTLP